MTSTTSTTTPTRRPFTGSCHCGLTRYVAYITLPPPHLSPTSHEPTTRIYKCNCTICQKMSYFHLRLLDLTSDFQLLSPLNPESPDSGLVDYQCSGGSTHWWFCGTCGMRCFAVRGEGEVQEAEVHGEKMKVWMVKKEGWNELPGGRPYLSVNAASLDAGQDGLDLREWKEKGWIQYLDGWQEKGEDRLGEPYEGGMY